MVVLHNLSAYNVTSLQQALACRQAQLRFLPHSSPDVSPGQGCTSTLKTASQAAKAHTREGVGTAIRKALETITAADAWNRFKHCNYALL
jgi:hypothetical protein